MKLYMKQKVFSFKDRFYIKDEMGNDIFYAEGEIFTLGKKLHLYDTAGQEHAFIAQKLLNFLPHFEVYMQGQMVAEVVKEFTFFRQKYTIHGPGWDIDGRVGAHDYQILGNGVVLATIHKAWMSFGDSYEISICDGVNPAMILACILAIDVCVSDANSAATMNNY